MAECTGEGYVRDMVVTELVRPMIDRSEALLGELWRCRYRHSEESAPLEATIKIYKAGEGQMYSADGYHEFCARAIHCLFRLSAVGFRAAIDSQDVRAFWRRATIPDWTDNQVWFLVCELSVWWLVLCRMRKRRRRRRTQTLNAATRLSVASHQAPGKPWVRIDFPEFEFGSVSIVPGSDSDRFRRARFGFGSVSPCQVRIRIGFAGPGSDSDRFWKGLRV